MDMKEKLVEILRKPIFPHELVDPIEAVADYLLDSGVTVQECGHWVSYQSDEPYGCQDEKEWYRCSKCGKDAYGRCYEDEWYSAPILSAHCPHCGEKMMPQPPKGE